MTTPPTIRVELMHVQPPVRPRHVLAWLALTALVYVVIRPPR